MLMTMRKAKGLEAGFVVIKGDCFYASTSPLKNAIYSLADMPTSFDEAQTGEAMRLGYVSLTRAKKKAFWFGEPSKPEGAFRVLAEQIGSA